MLLTYFRHSTSYTPTPNIWCLDVNDGMIVAGCSDGSIEFWDSANGMLKHRHKTAQRDSGIASIKSFANRLVNVLAGSLLLTAFSWVTI